jgi:polysaccharide chain length determinant protein (PEP-CTERM system associated)
MKELLEQLLSHVKGSWRFRWSAVAVAWAVALLGWAAVHMLKDIYESRTQVYVDAESVLAPLLKGLAVQPDVMGQVEMMQTLMLSRPNLERVARETDLFLDAQTPEEQLRVINGLQEKIVLERARNSNTFAITYTDSDPRRAHSVVQSLLDTFVEDTLGMKRTDVTNARRFLEAQIREYERRLTESENRLADFKRENLSMLPGEGVDFFGGLQNAAENLKLLQARYDQLATRRDELRRQLEGEDPSMASAAYGGTDPIDMEISAIQSQIDQLLLEYTEKHPNVQALKNRIAQLEEIKKSGGTAASTSGMGLGMDAAGTSPELNPIYQNTKMALGATEAEMAEVRSQIGNQRAQIAQLRGLIDQMPQVEAELKRLDRNYGVNKAQYDSLVKRLESANISTEAEQSADSVKFRVVEPPVVPLAPIGPNRGLLSTLVLVASLAAGLATAFLLAQMRPVFTSRDGLGRISGLPVLGAITKLTTERFLPWYRTQAALVAGAVGALLIGYFLNLLLSGVLRDATTRLLG